MIATETIAILLVVGVAMAFIATLYFWCEHNAKNDETFTTNPLKLKWVLGGVLGGAAAAGIVLMLLVYLPDMAWQEACAKFGAITGALGIVIAKVFNEGISMTMKWVDQKAKAVVEVAQDPEIIAMKAQLDEILKSLKGSS